MNPPKMLDSVCDMVVDLADARDQGLTIEIDAREYAFCGHGCLVKFAKSPHTYTPKADAWLAAEVGGAHREKRAHIGELPVVDNGMREWYKSCRCCLSDAYPEVVEQLDAEKAQAAGS